MNTKEWWLATGLVAAGLLSAACGSDDKHGTIGEDTIGADGGLIKGGGSGEDVCGKHLVQSNHAIPDMLIVLDKSGSMAPSGNETRTDRWTGSRNAVDEVTAMFEGTISFGLMTFPGAVGGGRNGGGGGMGLLCSPGMLDVPLAPGNANAIAQALGRMNAAGYTPTAATLDAALAIIGAPESADQTVTKPKYILLVTDGDPNCSADYMPSVGMNGIAPIDPVAREETVTAIKNLTEAGVKTFVVGFQTAGTSFADQLDMMAAAGGTGLKAHESVASGADLSTAFQKIAGKAASCSYKLSQTVVPSYVSVTVAGQMRRFNNAADGWTLGSDKKTIDLTGAACEAAQKGGVFTVEVNCDPVIGI